MPVINNHSYEPPFLLRSGHLNTIYPYIFRPDLIMNYNRIRLDTPDQDFIDIDTLFSNNNRLAILCHGLEGSSSSKYIKYTASILAENGWDVIAMNYRGCSGEMNRNLQMYHSGFTDDLNLVVHEFANNYTTIGLVGFSLGGNILLKYLGESGNAIHSSIKSAVGVSVPCDLSAGAQRIGKWDNYFYEKRFLITLFDKIKKKKLLFPKEIDLSYLNRIKSLRDFDEYYTGPIHGFNGAEHYYQEAHCKQFIPNIKTPTLLISALDDPFLPEQAYPYDEAESNQFFNFLPVAHGGHVGFCQSSSKYYWEEYKIASFLEDPLIISA